MRSLWTSDAFILLVSLGVGGPLLLWLRSRFWSIQRWLRHALPEALEQDQLAERVVGTLLSELEAGVDLAVREHPVAVLRARLGPAMRRTRRAVERDGRTGGWLAGRLLRHLAPVLHADLAIAPGGVIDLTKLRGQLLRYVHHSLLPSLRDPRAAYHGWARRGRRVGRGTTAAR